MVNTISLQIRNQRRSSQAKFIGEVHRQSSQKKFTEKSSQRPSRSWSAMTPLGRQHSPPLCTGCSSRSVCSPPHAGWPASFRFRRSSAFVGWKWRTFWSMVGCGGCGGNLKESKLWRENEEMHTNRSLSASVHFLIEIDSCSSYIERWVKISPLKKVFAVCSQSARSLLVT